MKETRGNLWDFPGWKVVPVSGSLKPTGAAGIYKGVALQARSKNPGWDHALGAHIKSEGNVPGIFTNQLLVTCPTQRLAGDRADLDLIVAGMRVIEGLPPDAFQTFYLPWLGCGQGGLRWTDVRASLAFLDDRFVAVELVEPTIRLAGRREGGRETIKVDV